MNTPALHNANVPLPSDPLRPVFWQLVFEEGYTVSSTDTTWNEIARSDALDSVSLPFTWGAVTRFEALSGGGCVFLVPPTPRPFFGLTRLAQGIVEASPTWVGSLFGYALPEYVVCLAITPQGVRVMTHPRPLTSFTLL